ncbi:SRPBCC family protein [Nocardia sp. NPDC049149]|uniref:SRPBCC family protein n=1 Tax=Nocardia sp. NPDC049149 TaxID=3364315 RepID=UPI00371812B8
MTRWFELEPVDKTFFDTATYREKYSMELPVDSGQVWAGFTSESPMTWCKLITTGRYTSPLDGIGTTRDIELAGGVLRLREYFFDWDDTARHHSFFVRQANLPLFRAFAEDYHLADTPNGCRFTWRFAYEPKPGLGLVHKVSAFPTRLMLSSLAADTAKHFGGTAATRLPRG